MDWKVELSPTANGVYWNGKSDLLQWVETTLKTSSSIASILTLISITSIFKISLLEIIELSLLMIPTVGVLVQLLEDYHRNNIGFLIPLLYLIGHLSFLPVMMFGFAGFTLVLFCCVVAVGEMFRVVSLITDKKGETRTTFAVWLGCGFILIYLVIVGMETARLIALNKPR